MFLRIANFNSFLYLLSIKAFRVACKAEICKASSSDFIVVSSAGNLFMKFGRFVLRPNCDELNPMLLVSAFVVNTALARAMS